MKSTLSVSLNTPRKLPLSARERERERLGRIAREFLLLENMGNGNADAGTRITRSATEDARKYVGFHAVSQEARN